MGNVHCTALTLQSKCPFMANLGTSVSSTLFRDPVSVLQLEKGRENKRAAESTHFFLYTCIHQSRSESNPSISCAHMEMFSQWFYI